VKGEVEIVESLYQDEIPIAGSLVKAFVANTSSTKGCFLRLTSSLTGHVLMKDLSDNFVLNPTIDFPIGKLLDARLLSVSLVQ
jgi:hypothetical protein